MESKEKTKGQLIEEIKVLQKRITKLEKSEFERKKAEEVLKMQGSVLKSMVEGVNVSDENGIILFTNPVFDAMFGYERGELIGKYVSILNAYSPEENNRIVAEVIEQLKTQEIWIGELNNVRKDKTQFVSYTRVSKLEVSGKLYWISVQEDITERKKAEEALRESEEKHRKLFEETTDAIFVADVETGILTDCNRAASELAGREKSELIGKHQRILHPPQKIEGGFSKTFKQHIAEKEGQVLETQVITKKGEIKDVAIRASRFELKGEKRIQAMFRDITGRKKAEEKLQQQKEFLEKVMKSLTHPFYVIDVKDYRIVMANSAACLGMLSKDSTCYALTHKRDKPCVGEHLCPLKEVKRTKKSVVVEHIHYDKDDNARNVEVHDYPIFDAEGNVVQMIEYSLDITERKKAEEALRESEEQYRTLVQNVPVAIYRTIPGPKGKFLMANPAYLKMFGLDSEEELKKIAVADVYMTSKDRKAFSDNLLAQGSIAGVELPLRKKDGTPFWGSVTARVVDDESGKNPYFECMIMDITERKRAGEGLKKKMRELETFQKVAVGRELKMVELKNKIKELETRFAGEISTD